MFEQATLSMKYQHHKDLQVQTTDDMRIRAEKKNFFY